MILCGHCGSIVEEGRRFCGECGAQVGFSLGSDLAESPEDGPVISIGVAAHRPNNAVADSSQPVNAGSPPREQKTSHTIVVALASLLLLSVLVILVSLKAENSNHNRNASRAVENQNVTLTDKGNNVQQVNQNAPQPTAVAAPLIKQEVINTLNGWAAATSSHDLDAHMSYYANALHTYYGRKNVDASFVRSNRAPAFTRYSELNVQLANINVMPDASGVRANAVFDKTYVFRGSKELSGSVQQMAWLEKMGNRWLITGEKDLQVYYVKK
jgi:hypothetical protein